MHVWLYEFQRRCCTGSGSPLLLQFIRTYYWNYFFNIKREPPLEASALQLMWTLTDKVTSVILLLLDV
uniref:Uncharacterized protein n=1 Tax=Anguilla anguilla TaxID=7936 RepID=A0A0E9X607_ANGAN